MEKSEHKSIFRKETLDRISSPEQLTDYLRVTNPGIWVVLAAVILLLAGILVWSAVGTLETTVDATVVVEQNEATIVTPNGHLAKDMPLRVEGQETTIRIAEEDAYGRIIGQTTVDLPDGTYKGVVVTEQLHPIEFLLTSR
ncbi:MAG: hypothetical protein K6A77_08505 [Clostridiales bacterium]|nr:hypothetical protein [Clostridiales bacterium]